MMSECLKPSSKMVLLKVSENILQKGPLRVGNSRLEKFAFALESIFFGRQLYCQRVARLESQKRAVHENQLCKHNMLITASTIHHYCAASYHVNKKHSAP
jgi:hypothetical protein